jgi:hypothetical protein
MQILCSFEYNTLRGHDFKTNYKGFLMLSKTLTELAEQFVFLSQRYAA